MGERGVPAGKQSRADRTWHVPPLLRELGRRSPARPAVLTGLRAALVTAAPLLAGHLTLQWPAFVWIAIGGFVAVLVDSGGSYPARALNMAVVTASAAAAASAAALLGHSPGLAIAGALVWATAGAFLRVYGPAGANAGLISSVVFTVSLATPVAVDAALARGTAFLAGGAWAAGLGLVLWPLDPLRPARRAVAQCYRSLAAYARVVAHIAEESREEDGGLADGFEGVRRALEDGRSNLAPGWSGRGLRDPAAERLFVLLEMADQMLGTLVALADVLDRQPTDDARLVLAAAVREVEPLLTSLATRMEQDGAADLHPPRWRSLDLPRPDAPDDRAEAASRHAGEIVWMLREFADGALETVAGFRARTASADPASARAASRGWLQPLRDNLSAHSVLLRHALRVGITTALAVAIAIGVGRDHGYWMPLTVLFILQPSTGLTMVRALQRVLGTVLGGVLAALIPLAVPGPLGLLGVIFALAGAAVAFWPVNYALFALFVTPTFVLLAELETGDWSLYQERIWYTLAGGLMAMAGARFFWSIPERHQFPAHMAAALRTLAGYLEASAAAAAGRLPDDSGLARLRRGTGLAVINVEESFQRLAVELGGGVPVEPSRSMLVYLRRLAAATVGLSTLPPSGKAEAEATQRFAAAAVEVLSEIAAAVAEQRSPAPMPPLLDRIPRDSLLRMQLERIDRPLRMIRDAAARASDGWG